MCPHIYLFNAQENKSCYKEDAMQKAIKQEFDKYNE